MSDSDRAKGNDSVDPGDGFHAVVTNPTEQELGGVDLVYQHRGEVIKALTLSFEPTTFDEVEAMRAEANLQRSQLLAEALCRFFNTGGDFDGARRICEQTMANLLTMAGGQELFPILPDPWEYISTDNPAPMAHVLYNMENGEAVRWIEGEDFEPVEMEEEDSVGREAEVSET